jgi:hypothetical protein
MLIDTTLVKLDQDCEKLKISINELVDKYCDTLVKNCQKKDEELQKKIDSLNVKYKSSS